jgi:hypothetical protein
MGATESRERMVNNPLQLKQEFLIEDIDMVL